MDDLRRMFDALTTFLTILMVGVLAVGMLALLALRLLADIGVFGE